MNIYIIYIYIYSRILIHTYYICILYNSIKFKKSQMSKVGSSRRASKSKAESKSSDVSIKAKRVEGKSNKSKRAVGKLPLMRSFARIKPASADKRGGVAAAQTISGWDEASGEVRFSAKMEGGKEQAFSHFQRLISPEDSQLTAYNVVCAPLVEQWIAGTDVDLIVYGQTGSGKTHTVFGPPKSMKVASDDLGADGGVGTISSNGVLKPEHGMILRTGFAALAAVNKINSAGDGSRAVLHGSMVEMSIMSASSQNAGDLLANKKSCFVDKHHHLEGAVHLPLKDTRSLLTMAAAVETRLTRGTNMNNSSSRSHCITVYTLHHLDCHGNVRASRFNFFDFMGSERFSGANSAHGGGSARGSQAGWEGIYANYSLLYLGEAVRAATNARRKKKGTIQRMGGKGFLNELLSGSLVGNALTAMITCLSPSARNGAESLLSCKYSKDMARMQNDPKPQPSIAYEDMIQNVMQELAKSSKLVAQGVAGKYQAKRMAEVVGCETTLRILRDELGCAGSCAADMQSKK